MAVTDVSGSSTLQAWRYRERAADARRDAAGAVGAARKSFLIIADQWEGLARGVEVLSQGKRDRC
jgi:hypothetical protein